MPRSYVNVFVLPICPHCNHQFLNDFMEIGYHHPKVGHRKKLHRCPYCGTLFGACSQDVFRQVVGTEILPVSEQPTEAVQHYDLDVWEGCTLTHYRGRYYPEACKLDCTASAVSYEVLEDQS